jgi:DNA helicase IV
VAEPFYRATGRDPMGLYRRRHFATRGRTILDIEDEVFDLDRLERGEIQGHGALLAALEERRSGYLTDIVATIQGQQDEIIRDPLKGIVVVQGGPGTGKTVVALHRAAYLLYTYRFPLEGQGVLVIGPNRLFLRYIERVLPSLGEAGVHMVVLADLIGDLFPDTVVRLADSAPTAEIKGDIAMLDVIGRAVRDRQRPLRDDVVVGYGLIRLRITVEQSNRIVREARRRFRDHNGARKFVEEEFYRALGKSHRSEPEPETVRYRLHNDPQVRAALEWMWPVLTPHQLLRDLFGSRALLASAGRSALTPSQSQLLHRRRGDRADDYLWSDADMPLLDEAHSRLGPRRRRKRGDADVRTYGHIVIDEAQDHTAMAMRMIGRRSLNGSMTIVGDIAQATAPGAAGSWDDVLGHVERPNQSPRMRELTLGYRIPGPNMALAARVLAQAAPELTPPRSVRDSGAAPRVVTVVPDGEGLAATVIDAVAQERNELDGGSVAVICPETMMDEMATSFARSGMTFGRATIASRNVTGGLHPEVTLVPVALVKGLELDGSVVVEPAQIVAEEPQGLRALYVALTRSTKRLCIVHEQPLPAVLAE